MSPIYAIDAIGLLSILVALPFLWRGRVASPSPEFWLALTGVFAMTAFRNLSNVLEWSGLSEQLDTFEDYSEVLLPACYFFVLLTYSQYHGSRQLRESEERYRTLVENVDLGIALIDANFRVVMANASHGEMFGKNPAKLIGLRCYREFERRDEVCPHCPGSRAMASGRAEEVETHGVRDDGSTLLVRVSAFPVMDEKGHPQGFIELVEDITEKRETLAALEESERRYRELVEGTSDLIVQLDREGRFTFVNSLAERVFEIPPEACIGQLAFDFVHEEDRQETIAAFERWISEHRESAAIENRQVGRDGAVCQMLWTVNLHYTEDGEVTGISAVGRDIGERKRAEEERLKLERQIQHSQKLESLGVLAGGIAHDFNNILMGVLGNAELAILRAPPESPARENIKSIEKAALRAADLARQMLAYSGKGQFRVEPILLNRLIQEMTHLLETVISKKAVLQFRLAEDLPLIEADATQVRQVVMNLITNASEAIGDRNGLITVSTGTEEVTSEYSTGVYPDDPVSPGSYVTIEVSDTGCGMNRSTQERIFDPFFTTKFTGRGLGLAAVLGIVRGHSGSIKVYTVPGQGTSFKILLPCARDESGASALSLERPDAEVGSWRGSGKVLVVDDEEHVRQVVKAALEQFGFEVLLATDGVEGVQVFTEHAGDIVAVLLDMTMPRMSGEEAFREMRKVCPEVRVILSSGYNEQEAVNRFSGKGLAGFIQKPYPPTRLLAKLKELLKDREA